MPEAPLPQGQGADPSAQPAPGGQGAGGGVGDVIVDVDKKLFQLTQLVGQSDQVPDEVKSAFGDALSAFRSGVKALMGAGGGDQGGDQGAPQGAPQGPMTEQQGASGAQPMSHRGPG